MLRFGETKIAKEKFNAAKKPIKIWDIKVTTKLVKTKTNSECLIGIKSDKARQFVKIC